MMATGTGWRAAALAAALSLALLVDCRAQDGAQPGGVTPTSESRTAVGGDGPAPAPASTAAATEATRTEARMPEQGQAGLPMTRVTFANPDGRTASFPCEVAATPEARTIGLMHRRSLAPGHGMLFVFPFAEQQGFWMKNTYIPLDMVFVGADRVVIGVVENARPLTLDLRQVQGVSQYVVELAAFTARDKGIAAGTRVAFDPPLPDVGR
jgi:uncharacterized membrane protein (UPF0127 family)